MFGNSLGSRIQIYQMINVHFQTCLNVRYFFFHIRSTKRKRWSFHLFWEMHRCACVMCNVHSSNARTETEVKNEFKLPYPFVYSAEPIDGCWAFRSDRWYLLLDKWGHTSYTKYHLTFLKRISNFVLNFDSKCLSLIKGRVLFSIFFVGSSIEVFTFATGNGKNVHKLNSYIFHRIVVDGCGLKIPFFFFYVI